jgi:PAS domain S-box-containing protein
VSTCLASREQLFPGPGEIANLCRAYDWASSPLGPPEGWPVALRTVVSTLLASRHPMFLFWGPECVQIYNDAYRPSLGSGPRHPAALGARGEEFWTEIWSDIGPQIEQVRSGGEATWHEDQLLPIERNGRIEDVYWTYSYSPVRSDTGEIDGVLVVCQETTKSVRTREAIQRIANRLVTHLESQTDAFITLDQEWRFTFANREAERVLESRRDQLIGISVWEAFPEAVGSVFDDQYRLARQSGQPVEFEQFFPPLNRWFGVRAFPSDEGLAVYFQDISDRKAREAELRESQRLVEIAGQVARVGGWSVDLGTGTATLSDVVCEVHELPPGTTFSLDDGLSYYAPESRPLIEKHFRRTAEEGEPYDLDLEILTATGRRVWVRSVGEAVRDEEGVIRRVQGAFQDISHQKQSEAELRDSERRFRELAESMPLVVWAANAEGMIDYQTEAIIRYTGKSREELAGEAWLNVLYPDDVEPTAAAWIRSVQTGEPYEVEFRIRRHDGAYRWFLTRAHAFRGADGEIVRWYGSSTDIHDRLQLERKARDLADRMTATLESITDAFYLLDSEWRFTFLNAQAERVLQRTNDELLGRTLWETFPVLVSSRLEEEFRGAVDTRVTAAFSHFYPPLERWLDVRAYPSDQGLAVYFRDITQERAAEDRLKEQAALLDRSQDAIMVRDLEHNIVFWNTAAERIYGWSREEALGRSVRDRLYADPAPFDAATGAVLADGDWTGELEQLRSDGSTVFVQCRWSLVRDEAGEPSRILAINTDATERKKLLSQFLRAQRMESIGTLAGGIAHDLNNVLAPILLSIGVLRMEIEDPDAQEMLATIEASAQRGADMVKQVLTFARGVEGSRLAVDLPQLIEDLGRVVRDTFPKTITFRSTLSEGLWAVAADRTQVHQVLLNLLINARDALPNGGELTIIAENLTIDANYALMSQWATPGRHVRVSVVDSGTGMPPEVVQQVFDPFFTTKEVGKGTGLGLSTVAAIMRSHGGFVNVYSEVGAGSTFRLYFPAAAEGGTESGGSEESVPLDLPRGQGELILVIDDEMAIREITRQTLEAFGYRVVTATDGVDAVGIYARRGDEIALVLTDILMPFMDGPSTIRALTRMNPAVRIIAASGLGANGGVARAATYGVKDFLPKPYTAETLLSAIHAALSDEYAHCTRSIAAGPRRSC